MRIINISNLEKCDIVLTTSSQKKPSGIIRKAIKSDISHAMLCVAYSSVIDSTSEGVQARNVQKMVYDDESSIYILRPKEQLSDTIKDNIINYARSIIGTRYSLQEAALSVSPIKGKPSIKQFCSRMVARAYYEAGILLVENPDFCTPADLKNSTLLTKIEPAYTTIDQDEYETIQVVGDTSEDMREITNKLLSRIREYDNDLEDINELPRLLLQHPELDDIISDAIKSSGYLNHIDIELKRFPWRYDKLAIVQLYHSLSEPNELFEYCVKTIHDYESGSFKHWQVNLDFYNELSKRYPYNSFILMNKLYLRLCFYLDQRVKTARALLLLYK
jgi:hypothetical protein